MTIWFDLTVDGMQLLAAYVAQLVREGVTFTIQRDKISVEVKLTGGY
jgi:hypothetical protein